MNEPEVTEAEYEWPYSPEIQALHEFKKVTSKFADRPEVVQEKTLEILDTILDQIKQDERPRLDWVKQVVGFRQDMWDATQEVIRAAKKQVFIVPSNFASACLDATCSSFLASLDGNDFLFIWFL